MSRSNRNRSLLTLAVALAVAAIVSANLRPAPARLPVLGIVHKGVGPDSSLSEVIVALGHAMADESFRDNGILLVKVFGEDGTKAGFLDGQCIYLERLPVVELTTAVGTVELSDSMEPDDVRGILGRADVISDDFGLSVEAYEYPEHDLRLEVYYWVSRACVMPVWPTEHTSHFRISRLSEPMARSFAIETAIRREQR